MLPRAAKVLWNERCAGDACPCGTELTEARRPAVHRRACDADGPFAREPDPAGDARERRVLSLALVDHDHVTSLSPRAPLPCARRGAEASPETSMPAAPATAVTLQNADRKSFGRHFGGHCSLPTGTRLDGQGRGGIFMPHCGRPTARTRVRRRPHFPGPRPISRPMKNATFD